MGCVVQCMHVFNHHVCIVNTVKVDEGGGSFSSRDLRLHRLDHSYFLKRPKSQFQCLLEWANGTFLSGIH